MLCERRAGALQPAAEDVSAAAGGGALLVTAHRSTEVRGRERANTAYVLGEARFSRPRGVATVVLCSTRARASACAHSSTEPVRRAGPPSARLRWPFLKVFIGTVNCGHGTWAPRGRATVRVLPYLLRGVGSHGSSSRGCGAHPIAARIHVITATVRWRQAIRWSCTSPKSTSMTQRCSPGWMTSE